MRKPRGHIRKRPFGYAHTEEEAEAARDRLLKEIAVGREQKNRQI